MVSTSGQHETLSFDSPGNRETMNYFESQVLLAVLRNQEHPQHRCCWSVIAQQLQQAAQLTGRPLPDLAREIEYLRRDLATYDYRSHLKTWLLVRIARRCLLADDSANNHSQ